MQVLHYPEGRFFALLSPPRPIPTVGWDQGGSTCPCIRSQRQLTMPWPMATAVVGRGRLRRRATAAGRRGKLRCRCHGETLLLRQPIKFDTRHAAHIICVEVCRQPYRKNDHTLRAVLTGDVNFLNFLFFPEDSHEKTSALLSSAGSFVFFFLIFALGIRTVLRKALRRCRSSLNSCHVIRCGS